MDNVRYSVSSCLVCYSVFGIENGLFHEVPVSCDRVKYQAKCLWTDTSVRQHCISEYCSVLQSQTDVMRYVQPENHLSRVLRKTAFCLCKKKAQISSAVTAQLIRVFGFANK